MAKRRLQFSAVMTLNSRARAFADQSSIVAEEAVREVIARAVKMAQDNVRPGKGPSPHTGPFKWGHRYPYEDMEVLVGHVLYGIWLQGFHTEGSVFTDLDYGSYLEVGWRQRGVKPAFYRYPWLKPAFMEAMKLLPDLAAEKFRTQMQDLDEETIVSGAALESWADAAQRWADSIKSAKGTVAAPVYSTPTKQRVKRPRINLRAKKRGRPKDPTLGEELPSERGRVRKERAKRKRDREQAEKFSADIVKKTHQDGDFASRGKIDVDRVVEQNRQRNQKRELNTLKGIGKKKDKSRNAFEKTAQEIRESAQRLKDANADLMGAVKPKKRKPRKTKP